MRVDVERLRELAQKASRRVTRLDVVADEWFRNIAPPRTVLALIGELEAARDALEEARTESYNDVLDARQRVLAMRRAIEAYDDRVRGTE